MCRLRRFVGCITSKDFLKSNVHLLLKRKHRSREDKADWYCKKERPADHEASSSCCNRSESQKEKNAEGIRNRRVIFWPVGIFASYLNNFLSSASVIRTANCMISYNNGKPRHSDNVFDSECFCNSCRGCYHLCCPVSVCLFQLSSSLAMT